MVLVRHVHRADGCTVLFIHTKIVHVAEWTHHPLDKAITTSEHGIRLVTGRSCWGARAFYIDVPIYPDGPAVRAIVRAESILAPFEPTATAFKQHFL